MKSLKNKKLKKRNTFFFFFYIPFLIFYLQHSRFSKYFVSFFLVLFLLINLTEIVLTPALSLLLLLLLSLLLLIVAVVVESISIPPDPLQKKRPGIFFPFPQNKHLRHCCCGRHCFWQYRNLKETKKNCKDTQTRST